MIFKDLEPEHRNNLIALRDGLIGMYGNDQYHHNFYMRSYQNTGHLITKHTCNTSACVLGHGPIFGIGHLGSSWIKYSRESFGLGPSMMTWQFLFNDDWPSDIQEAIARLSVYIEGFDPEDEYWDCASSYVGDNNV